MDARAAGLIAALALLVGACGGDDGGGDEANAPAGSGGDGAAVDFASAGPAEEGIDGVVAYRIESADHTEAPVDYGLVPPPGGPHHPAWANCGFYDEPLPDEHVVHDLEHGAVWLAYSPDLADAEVEAIHDLVRANDKTVAAPHEQLPDGAAVVASAWGRQVVLDAVEDPRLEQFVVQYQDGSQAPEAGVTCTGSPVGHPIP